MMPFAYYWLETAIAHNSTLKKQGLLLLPKKVAAPSAGRSIEGALTRSDAAANCMR
jgi:hypothetical protein